MHYLSIILLAWGLFYQSQSVDRLNYSKQQTKTGFEFYKNCQYSEAIDTYIIALHSLDSIEQNYNTDSLRGIIYQNIGDILSDCDKYEASKEKYFKALDFSIKANDSINIANCYRKIGNLCYYLSDTENPDTLLYYMQKSLPYAKNEDPYYTSFYLALISVIKDNITIFDIIPTRSKGITLLPNDFNERLPYIENYISWALWIVGEHEKAIYFANNSFSSNNIKQKITANELLCKMYLETGDTVSAISSAKSLDSLNHIIAEAKRKAAGIESVLRKYENEIAEKENHTSKTSTFVITSIVLIVLFVLSFFIIKKRKQTKRAPSLISNQLSNFESSEIVRKIIEKCDYELDLTASNVSTSMICLSESDKKELIKTTNVCLNSFIEKFRTKYPDISNDELYYILLSLINLSEVQKAALLGLSYQGCISRRNRIMNKTNMTNIHDDLHIIMKNIMQT